MILTFCFKKGYDITLPYYICTPSERRVGQWKTIVKKIRRSCPCVTKVEFWSSFFTELLLDLHISKWSHVKMLLIPSSEPEEVIRPLIPHTSIDFLFFSFFAPVSSPSLPLCCLLKCAVQQEKGKIILLPAMQDGSQKAGVKCSVSFLKLL